MGLSVDLKAPGIKKAAPAVAVGCMMPSSGMTQLNPSFILAWPG